MTCPKCQGSLDEQPGSPVSPYIDTYQCPSCGWRGLRCGDASCDGYLEYPEGFSSTVRYTCATCGWTGTGPRFAAA